MENRKHLSRRQLLKATAGVGAGAVLSSCAQIPAGEIQGSVNLASDPTTGEITFKYLGTPWATVAPGAVPATATPEVHKAKFIQTLRFQPATPSETHPDRNGQTHWVNQYLLAAMNATQAPINRPLDYVYPGKNPATRDLYEAVSGIQQEARSSAATTYVGKSYGRFVIPTGVASVQWCNNEKPEDQIATLQALRGLEQNRLYTFAFYGRGNRQYNSVNQFTAGGDSARLLDGRSLLFLAMPQPNASSQIGAALIEAGYCNHPIGSWGVAVQ